MNIDNMLLLANPDHYDTGKDTAWYSGGTWSDTTVYTIGTGITNKHIRFRCPIPGVKTRVEIDFEFYQGPAPAVFPVYLVTNEAAVPQQAPNAAIATAYTAAVSGLQTIAFDNVSFDAETFYLVFLGDPDNYKEFKIKEVRARTSYEVSLTYNVTMTPDQGGKTWANNHYPITYRLYVKPDIGTYNPFDIQSAIFHWRLGEAGTFTDVTMTVQSKADMYKDAIAVIEIPRGTFDEGTIGWYVSAAVIEGTIVSGLATSIKYFQCSIGAVYCNPIRPKDGFFGNNEPITFQWSLGSYVPTYIRQTDIQYSYNGELWLDLASVPLTGYESRFYTAPANTFLTGTVYWRARAVAANGGRSKWSNVLTFEALGAPIVTNLAASAVPFSTVTWEVNGELAYRVMVDDKLFGPYRDPDAMSYTFTEPLADGEHTIKVQAQNKYGLWSAFAETTVSITNVSGAAVVITGEATSNGVELTITGGEQADLFLIYRDGANVARTTARFYKDRTALGQHQYYVIQAIADGYYTKSNTVEVVSVAECPEIALLSGGNFLEFGYTDSAYPEITVTRKTNVVKTHYSGAKFPAVETGDQEELSVSFGTFWLAADSDAADQLEAMQGEAVILKYPPNHVLVGVLDNLHGVDFGWKRAYTIYLEQMEWRDFTDES